MIWHMERLNNGVRGGWGWSELPDPDFLFVSTSSEACCIVERSFVSPVGTQSPILASHLFLFGWCLGIVPIAPEKCVGRPGELEHHSAFIVSNRGVNFYRESLDGNTRLGVPSNEFAESVLLRTGDSSER